MSELQINTTQNVKIKFKIGYALILNKVFGAFEDMDEWSQIGVNSLIGLPAVFYTLLLESFLEGQTIGKRVVKIRVVKIDGYQASFSDYLIRWFFRIVDIYLLGLGFFIMIFNIKNQRLGDMAAGTSVIVLKNKINISHTILEEIADSYVPTYPSVIKLSDNDARIIKDTFMIAKDSKDYNTLIKLRQKIIEVTAIKENLQSNDVDFIDTILKDYNFYTQNM